MRDREAEGLADEEIIARVLSGETELFAALVRRHQARVYRLGLSFLKDGDEAEDFAQEVLVRAYTALGSFGGRAKFSTWLLRIAYNLAINTKQRRKPADRLEPETVPDLSGGTEEEHLREETRKAVRAAVAGLPERQAVCVELFFYYDLKYREIEEITGLPVNTIKSHVFRAKKALREALEEGREALHAS